MNQTRSAIIFSLLTAVFFLTFGHITTAAPGDLDTTFSEDGKLTDFLQGGGINSGRAVAVGADGKIVVAGGTQGNSSHGFAVVRYNPNGSLDASFDGDGIAVTPIGIDGEIAHAVAIQPDGKIVAAGAASLDGVTSDFALVRYNSDGSLDASFDGDGKVTTSVSPSGDRAHSIVLQPDGKIITAGFDVHTTLDVVMIRYNSDGSLDTSFGGDGIVITPNGRAYAVALQPDGKIIAAGSSGINPNWDFAVFRYNVDGSLDTSFDGDGKAVTPITAANDEAYAIALQTDGKIVAAGASSLGCTLVRYQGDGSLDTSFDGDGKVGTPFGTFCSAYALEVQSDGKIVAVGSSIGVTWDFAVIRYNPDGSLDTSFDGDGKVSTEIGPFADEARGAAIQPDGRILAAGFSNSDNSINHDFAITRYNSDGTLDLSFDSDGKATTDIGGFLPHTARGFAMQPDGKIVVAGSRFNSSNNDFAIFRYNPDGSPDNSFDGGGKVITQFAGTTNDQAFAVAIQPDGKIVAAGSSGINFAVSRYNQNGSLDSSFDGDGRVITAFSLDGNVQASSIALQSDGKIVVAGTERGLPTAYRIVLARYNANGSLDTSFDGDGKVIGPYSTSANSVVIQVDGKIITGGGRLNPFPTYELFCLFRYNADGSPDTSFGGDGEVTTRVGIETSAANALVVQPNGKIIAAGTATFDRVGWREDFALARYNTDGSLDRSFDWDGIVITPTRRSLDHASAVTVQIDGKIVAAGRSLRSEGGDYDFAVVRYKSNGLLDDSPIFLSGRSIGETSESFFGNGGKVFIDLGGNDSAYGLAIDSLGRAVIAGESNQRFAVVRLLGDSKPATPILSISGRILTPAGRGIPNARVTITDTKNVSHTLITNAFGYYRFLDIPGGGTRTISVSAKRYNFTASPQIVTLNDDLVLDFHAAQ